MATDKQIDKAFDKADKALAAFKKAVLELDDICEIQDVDVADYLDPLDDMMAEIASECNNRGE